MVPLNKGTATMLVSPDNPLRIELLPSCQRGQVGIWKLSMLMLRVTSAFGLISRRALSRQSVLATCPEVLSLGSPFLQEMGMCIFRSYHKLWNTTWKKNWFHFVLYMPYWQTIILSRTSCWVTVHTSLLFMFCALE